VSVGAGEWALIGADGTNAILLENGDLSGGGGEANTSSSAGGTVSLVQTKSGVNLPFRGISATSPVLATQNTNDCTLSMTGGSNGQFLIWSGGAAGWGNTATFVGLGTTPATAGEVRIPNAGTVQFRNAANSANFQALSVDSGGNLMVGDTTNVGAVYLRASAGGIIYGRIGGAVDYSTLTTSLQSFAVPVASGTTPATTGQYRLPNATSIDWRNAANSANINGVSVDSGGNLMLGDTSGVSAVYARAGSGGGFYVRIGGAFDYLYVNASDIQFSSRLMGSVANSKGLEINRLAVTLGADPHTLTASEYAYSRLDFSGGVADNDVIFPTGEGVWFVRNNTGNAITLRDAGSLGVTDLTAGQSGIVSMANNTLRLSGAKFSH